MIAHKPRLRGEGWQMSAALTDHDRIAGGNRDRTQTLLPDFDSLQLIFGALAGPKYLARKISLRENDHGSAIL